MVQSAPMRVGCQAPTWTTQLSWTLVRGPTTMPLSGSSPRSTAPNQTLASDATVTLPMSTASGARKASGATRGRAP